MKQIDYKSLEIEGIDYSDYPDFCDAYFSGGLFTDGTPLDAETLEKLNEDNYLIHETVWERIH